MSVRRQFQLWLMPHFDKELSVHAMPRMHQKNVQHSCAICKTPSGSKLTMRFNIASSARVPYGRCINANCDTVDFKFKAIRTRWKQNLSCVKNFHNSRERRFVLRPANWKSIVLCFYFQGVSELFQRAHNSTLFRNERFRFRCALIRHLSLFTSTPKLVLAHSIFLRLRTQKPTTRPSRATNGTT